MPASEVDEALEVCSEEPVNPAPDLISAHRAPVLSQKPVGVRQDRSHGAARISPFINHLLEHARIRMLWNEAEPDHLDAFAGHLLYYGRLVEKPPTTERQQVAEFPRINAELMLVFAAQYADQKAVLRKLNANVFHCAKIGLADRIAGKPYRRVHLVAHPDHQRQRNVELATRGNNRLFQQAAPQTVLRIFEGIRQGTGHVDRLHAAIPVGKKAAHFGYAVASQILLHSVALARQNLPMLRPLVQNAIQPQNGMELAVGRSSFHPQRRLLRIQWIVRHDHFADTGQLENVPDVRLELLVAEIFAGLAQIC